MKLLVISLAGIGDTLFATPLIRELRANFPDATIDALVLWRGAKDVLTGNPNINKVYQHNFISETTLRTLQFLLRMRRERYDVSFNTHPQSRLHYRFVAAVIGARDRLSHWYHSPKWVDSFLVNRTIPQNYSRHAVENNLDLLQLVGGRRTCRHHRYELFLTAQEEEWAKNFLEENKLACRRLLGMHVGSGGTKNLALRRWPIENYFALIRQLERAQPDLSVILFGGPEEEVHNAELKSKFTTGKVIRSITRDLRQAAALIRHCHGFLSVDTALMHVAAAVGARGQVVIETPTWNKPIEPYGNPFTLVKNPAVAGRNLEFYRYDGWGIRGSKAEIRKCMESVTVEAVVAAVNTALA